MTKKFLGSALSHWLLLNPTAETQGNGPAAAAAKTPEAKPTTHLGMSAVDLVDAIEADPDAFATEAGDEDEEGASQNSETQKAEKAKADAAAAKKSEDEKAAKAKADAEAKAKEGKADDAKTIELNADQKAWLELRAAAKTAEEAAELDKQAPAFSDEEWAQAEKTFTGENGENGEKPKADDVTAQLASVQTELAAVKAKEEAASKRLKEVETELAAAKAKPVAVAQQHPLFLADATELERAEQQAYAIKKWATENWDGAEAVAASGDQPAVPAYTAAQVRKASANAEELLQRVIPAAREKLAAHISANSQTAQVYPELFNPQATPLQPNMATPYQAREMILRQLPGLRTAIPSINTVLGDAFVGEQLRVLLTSEKPTEDAKSLAAALVKAVPTLAKFMPALTAPGKAAAKASLKLPAKPIVPLARPGSAGGRVQRPGSGKPAGTPNVSKFVTQRTENGGDELSALTETLRNVNVG